MSFPWGNLPCPFMPVCVSGMNIYSIKVSLFRALIKMYFYDYSWSCLFNVFLPNKTASCVKAGARILMFIIVVRDPNITPEP